MQVRVFLGEVDILFVVFSRFWDICEILIWLTHNPNIFYKYLKTKTFILPLQGNIIGGYLKQGQIHRGSIFDQGKYIWEVYLDLFLCFFFFWDICDLFTTDSLSRYIPQISQNKDIYFPCRGNYNSHNYCYKTRAIWLRTNQIWSQ